MPNEITKADLRNKVISLYDSAVDSITSMFTKNVTIKRQTDDLLSFSICKKAYVLYFSYTGVLQLVDYDIAGAVPFIRFSFNQEDTGRFDTACDIFNIALLPEKLKVIREVDKYFDERFNIANVKKKTTSFDTFIKEINNTLEGYLR